MELDRIRNFSIIAHIDHGKSTLADRMLEITGTVTQRESKDRMLDGMDLERERGITIKAVNVTLAWEKDGETYQLNLIDTPGHVDFNYEVSRSLAACEGALLLVDATQGVEAQTVANCYLAVAGDVEVIPVLNKIDLPTADPDEISEEIENSLGLDCTDAPHVSAKTGQGVRELLDRIVDQIPPPKGDPNAPLQALVIDAIYDDYRGIVVYVRIMNGTFRAKETVLLMSRKASYDVTEVGKFAPKMTAVDSLSAGEVGYFWGAIKSLEDIRIGETLTHSKESGPACKEALPGYEEVQPMVYAGIFPTSNADLETLRKALTKL